MLKQQERVSLFNPPANRIILKVSAININFKSIPEKLRIIDSFGKFLNSITSTIQIICDSEVINPNDWKLKTHDEDYHSYLKELIEKKNIVEKTFYLATIVENEEEIESTRDNLIKQLKSCDLRAEVAKDKETSIIPFLNPGFIKIGEYFYDTLIVEDWPNVVQPGFLESIYNLEKNTTISMFIKPFDIEEAKSYLDKKIVKRSSSIISKNEDDEYLGDYDEEIVGAVNMRDELVKNEGKFFFMSYYITVKNKSFVQLQKDINSIKSTLKGMMIKTRHAFLRQDDGYKNSLPHGFDYIGEEYNFTTTPLKMFFPFISVNIMDKNGIMIGENLANGSLIFLDHFSYFTSSMLILGKAGSGKSFTVKSQIEKMINQGIEVTVIDTEGEFLAMKNLNKYIHNPNLIIIKKEEMNSYEEYLQNYLRNVNKSYETGINFKPRFLVIDEFWRFMKKETLAEIIQNIAKAGRKRWLGIGAITQEVTDVLKHEYGKSLIANCSIKILLKQEVYEKELIQKTFGISSNEWSTLVTSDEGEGILFAGTNHVRFKTLVSSEQYKYLTTKPHERILM